MTDHLNDSPAWREKYLSALDEQERLEKTFAEQQMLLRSALVRVSLAADGQDETLDELLAELRSQLRSDLQALEMRELLERVGQAALQFERQREQNSLDVRHALTDAVKPFQHFKLSTAVKKEVADYLAQLPERSKQVRYYPELLQQLAVIQRRVVEDIGRARLSFLDRLLGVKSQTLAAEALRVDESTIEEAAAVATEQDAQSPPEHTGVALRITPRANSSVPELGPEYAQEIARVLTQFLASLENEAVIKDKVEAIRQQVAEGLAEASLIPTLETVRDLVMEAYLAANHAFASYLKHVNQELAEIYAVVGGAVQHQQQDAAATHQLHREMMREVDDLEATMETATDIKTLKVKVKSQIGNIRQAVSDYQQKEAAQQQLAQQLAALSEKIKIMEDEAQKNHTTLEKHRYKSLHDPLTELPNREAYNERARAEVSRWQRYQRPLTIAIIDIDHFKNINDSFGHQAGDRVIRVIGRSIAKRLREVDFFCRYGGEEFVALMPETSVETALVVVNKIREAIAKAAFNYKNQSLSISISVGLTEFAAGDDLASAFERADKALYRAKTQGRNRCEVLRREDDDAQDAF